MYEILFHERAKKQLKKLPFEIQERILAVLGRLKVSPHNHVKRLVGTPYFRARAGDYRIILDIQDKKLIVFVLELGHRKNIYD